MNSARYKRKANKRMEELFGAIRCGVSVISCGNVVLNIYQRCKWSKTHFLNTLSIALTLTLCHPLKRCNTFQYIYDINTICKIVDDDQHCKIVVVCRFIFSTHLLSGTSICSMVFIPFPRSNSCIAMQHHWNKFDKSFPLITFSTVFFSLNFSCIQEEKSEPERLQGIKENPNSKRVNKVCVNERKTMFFPLWKWFFF